MITQKTAEQIYHCHREIEAGEALLVEVLKIAEQMRQNPTDMPATLQDVFGRRQRNLQLGIPCGKDSHRLFDVSWAMAEPIIKTHIANKRALLEEVSQRALLEAAQRMPQ